MLKKKHSMLPFITSLLRDKIIGIVLLSMSAFLAVVSSSINAMLVLMSYVANEFKTHDRV